MPSPKLLLLALAAVIPLTSCKPVDDRREVVTVREFGDYAPKPVLGLTLRQRVGLEAEPSAPAGPPFSWEKPEGWKEAPGSAMRVANFTFGPEDEGECYFSVLPGGGGLLLNVNRWRGQMGLEPIDEETAAALPDRQFLFGNGKSIDLEGDFKPMGATEASPGYRMLGVIMPELNLGEMRVAFFVKMTGPSDLVEAERENFEAFCDSLRMTRG